MPPTFREIFKAELESLPYSMRKKFEREIKIRELEYWERKEPLSPEFCWKLIQRIAEEERLKRSRA